MSQCHPLKLRIQTRYHNLWNHRPCKRYIAQAIPIKEKRGKRGSVKHNSCSSNPFISDIKSGIQGYEKKIFSSIYHIWKWESSVTYRTDLELQACKCSNSILVLIFDKNINWKFITIAMASHHILLFLWTNKLDCSQEINSRHFVWIFAFK